ncbi:MAG: flavohemoglobin expression-modulating QEGLA motif protein, partial [Magnetococcales bacterium]|nr:flavohemoglobin expression-modulating QEGLA motif protein [Magnetococcales bacterium]
AMKTVSAENSLAGSLVGLLKEEADFIEKVARELSKKGRVRTALPGWGRLHVDRALPFICIYRKPVNQPDSGMDKLLAGESSFLAISGGKHANKLLSAILATLVETIGSQFGAFLVFELWSESNTNRQGDKFDPLFSSPSFHIFSHNSKLLTPTLRTLEQNLSGFKFQKRRAQVKVSYVNQMPRVRGLSSLSIPNTVDGVECHLLGLQILPLFRGLEEVDGCEVFPALFRQFRRRLSHIIRKTLFQFSESRTTHRPPHFQAMGPRALTKLVWEVDSRLSGISDHFDYLFQVTPINSHGAWLDFRKNKFEKEPTFNYRPLPYDSSELKRLLFQIPVEQVEDPALSHIFREKQEELDRLISLLNDCNTPRFLHLSILTFGKVDEALLKLAKDILANKPEVSRSYTSRIVDVGELSEMANAEIRHYRRLNPEFLATVQVRDDVHCDFLVSKGELFIGKETQRPEHRVIALLQHEIGVHLLTYFNGHGQPFKLLGHGLAGYEELQEGLAVLAEYLVGGLTYERLRVLAARVVAVHSLTQGAEFTQTFNLLHKDYGFTPEIAFQISMRVYRGGGLTKDHVYLRGLVWVLKYLGNGGDLESLWIGKIGVQHINIIQELLWREVITPAPLSPRFMHELSSRERMEKLHAGATVLELINS